MAKRVVRTTTTRRDVDVESVKTNAISNQAATGRPNGHPTEDEVRVRAYHRYLGRGATDGDDVQDWVEAEKELRLERRS